MNDDAIGSNVVDIDSARGSATRTKHSYLYDDSDSDSGFEPGLNATLINNNNLSHDILSRENEFKTLEAAGNAIDYLKSLCCFELFGYYKAVLFQIKDEYDEIIGADRTPTRLNHNQIDTGYNSFTRSLDGLCDAEESLKKLILNEEPMDDFTLHSYSEFAYAIMRVKLEEGKSRLVTYYRTMNNYILDAGYTIKHSKNREYVSHLKERVRKIKQAISTIDSSQEHMIEHNQRLALDIAKHYMNRGVPLLDLMQYANLGLLKAFERFDYRLGNKFSTYATWWIKQTVSRAIQDTSKTIRKPAHIHDFYGVLWKFRNNFFTLNGRFPSMEETVEQVEMGKAILKGGNVTIEEKVAKITEIILVMQDPRSLDFKFDSDEESSGTYSEVLEDKSASNPAAFTGEEEASRKIDEILARMIPQEEVVLRLRFGVGHPSDYTLREVGEVFGKTRERVRQIEAKALIHFKNIAFEMGYENIEDFF